MPVFGGQDLSLSQPEEKKVSDCGVCHSKLKVLGMGSFSYCPSCRTCYNNHYFISDYSDTYFTVDYRNQYGKTYEEDFNVINSFAEKRINKIHKLLKKPESLLEIGCALGFFMNQAIESGFIEVKGIEISKYASVYAKSRFDFDVYNGSFNDYSDKKKYDIVAAWYVLEHDPDCLLAIEKAASLVNDKGVLACSLPSIYGPLFKYNFEKWKETHPNDHSIDFSPKSIKLFLKSIGFSKVKVYPASIHPERVFDKNNKFFQLKSYFYKIFCNYSSFADTIEIYAKK